MRNEGISNFYQNNIDVPDGAAMWIALPVIITVVGWQDLYGININLATNLK